MKVHGVFARGKWEARVGTYGEKAAGAKARAEDHALKSSTRVGRYWSGMGALEETVTVGSFIPPYMGTASADRYTVYIKVLQRPCRLYVHWCGLPRDRPCFRSCFEGCGREVFMSWLSMRC